MSRMTTVGRRGIVAAFAATIIISTAACGTQTGNEVEDSVPAAPAAIQPPAPTTPSSADSAERRGAAQELMPPTPPTRQPTPAGKRVPD